MYQSHELYIGYCWFDYLYGLAGSPLFDIHSQRSEKGPMKRKNTVAIFVLYMGLGYVVLIMLTFFTSES